MIWVDDFRGEAFGRPPINHRGGGGPAEDLWVPIVYLNHAPDGPRNSPADSPKIPGAPILH